LGPLERRLDPDRLGREVLRRLVRQERRQLVDEPAEVGRRRVPVAEQRELVPNKRVSHFHDLAGHGSGSCRRFAHVWYDVYPRKPGYNGRCSHNASLRDVSCPMSASSASASTMIRPTPRKSSSSKPRIVAAGVPSRTPDATVGGRSSNGTVFRFAVILTSWRRSSASLPVHSV